MSTHQYADGLVIDLVHHGIEELHAFEFENQQGVFLFVAGVLYGMFQLVQFAQVLFPRLVDGMQHDGLLESLHDGTAFRFVSLFEWSGNLINTTSVRHGHHDVLIHVPLCLIHLFDDRLGHSSQHIRLLLETFHGSLEGLFAQIFTLHAVHLVLRKRHFHGHDLDKAFLATLIVVILDDVHATVPNHIGDVHPDTLPHQGVATLLINHRTLFVHHVVVFQQTLAHAEVVLFHLLLGTLDGIADHLVFNHLAVFKAQLVHHPGNPFASKQTHQLVLQGHEENG